ncbi:dioxygenase [Kineococcus radiotolerans]|nr:class III extradiol ring-cleavage dioxygenase [Kineococcus radiotolerans]
MPNPFDNPNPAGAFDDFLRTVAPAAKTRHAWTPADGPMPALYLSHGAPPLFDDPHWINQLFGWAQNLPTPRAVLIVSAHWESQSAMLSSPVAATPLVYDFGGFAQRYFEMTYATPDATTLAAQVAALMPDTESLHTSATRGLDHGAWVPLKVMYPYADVPVLQLSMPTHDPQKLLDLGRRLRPLREQGVLVIGSGYMTHGLPYITRDMIMYGTIPGWSSEFDAWSTEALLRGDIDTLADYRRAPGMPYAHPTVEHFTPLFITMGAATDATAAPKMIISDYAMGMAKRSFQVA